MRWLGRHAFIAEAIGLIPYGGTKIPQAKQYCLKKKVVCQPLEKELVLTMKQSALSKNK